MKFETLSILSGTNSCNARCPFCISRMTGKNVPKELLINWRNFDKACQLSQINQVSTIIITGKGEPTLYPEQISDYLTHLKPFSFPIIELQTNGIVLETEMEKYKPYLEKWYELGLTFISISIGHYDSEKNRAIYTPYLKKYIDMPNLIARLHQYGFSVRLSCTLVKDGIDNVKEAKKMIETAKTWKAEQLTLRKVAMPKVSKDKEVGMWTKKHMILGNILEKIGLELEQKGKRLATFDYGGAVFDYGGQNVCFTNALTLQTKSQCTRQAIFCPDGHLRYDWQYQGALIF